MRSSDQISASSLVPRQRLARALAAGALALACLAVGAPPVLADQVVSYQVQPGDTVWDLASQFGVAPGEIVAANSLPDLGQLPVGQAIVIKVPTAPELRVTELDRPWLDTTALTEDVVGYSSDLSPGSFAVLAPPLPHPVAVAPIRVVRAPPARPAPPKPTIISAPYFSQLDGSIWGPSNCGPTSLAMALAALGVSANQMSLRHLADVQMGIADPSGGTTWESLVYAAKSNGVATHSLYGSGKSYHTWSIGDLKHELSQGHPVLLLVRYWSMPDHASSNYSGDHYIVALGFAENGDLVFHDPASYGSGAGATLTPSQLDRAWSNTAVGLVRTALALTK